MDEGGCVRVYIYTSDTRVQALTTADIAGGQVVGESKLVVGTWKFVSW